MRLILRPPWSGVPAADVAAEVEASQTEGRNYSSELFRLKAAQDEAVEHLDIVKRENKVYTSYNVC